VRVNDGSLAGTQSFFTSSGVVRISWTDSASGSFSRSDLQVMARRGQAFPGSRVVSPKQVHGVHVAIASHDRSLDEFSAEHFDDIEVEADAVVTQDDDLVLSVITADCAPIALWTDSGTVALVHAGWQGLLDGVIAKAVEKIRALTNDVDQINGWLGACIHPECYEFGNRDLALLAAAFGPSVESETTSGGPAFDLPAGVRSGFAQLGVVDRSTIETCTACSRIWSAGSNTHADGARSEASLGAVSTDGAAPSWYSWRARRDTGRQALFVWHERDAVWPRAHDVSQGS
jgi:copper oxidase (laccase) domain-containing protein